MILLIGVIGYLLFIYLYLLIVQRRASRKFKRESRKLENYRHAWELLERMYEREEQEKAPKMTREAVEAEEVGEAKTTEDTLGI